MAQNLPGRNLAAGRNLPSDLAFTRTEMAETFAYMVTYK